MDHYYIYCLHNDDLPEYYVGHTKNWGKRWYGHTNDSKRYSHLKVYQYINNNGGINNFKMEVLDQIYCNLKEAKKLERHYIELLGATLNQEVPGRTEQEYHNWYNPIYYEKNKEQISEQHKEKFTCICGSTLRGCAKQRHFRSEKHINFIRFNIGY